MSRSGTRTPSSPANAVEAAFAGIRADRRHGAHDLARAALRSLNRLLDHWSCRAERPSRAELESVAKALEAAQPAMGPFLRWAAEWRRIERRTSSNGFLRAARGWVRQEATQLRAEEARLARTARRRFPPLVRHVVTLSRSRSVLRALSGLPSRRRPSRISVLESEPGGEGRKFAGDLRRRGFRARTVSDAAGLKSVREADLVLIGADAVFSDGSVSHKVGTKALARAAFRSGVPVIVVAGRSKFTLRPAPRRPLPALFDRTPSRYVTEFWTDEGSRLGGRSRHHAPRPAVHQEPLSPREPRKRL